MAGGELTLVPLAACTAAAAVCAIAGHWLRRQAVPLVCAAGLAFACALWYVRSQDSSIWFLGERAFLVELVSAGLPPLLVGLTVLSPARLGTRTRSLLTSGVALVLIVSWPLLESPVATARGGPEPTREVEPFDRGGNFKLGPVADLALDRPLSHCNEVEISLTGGQVLTWDVGPGLRFHGSSRVSVCTEQRQSMSGRAAELLAAEWAEVVKEENFGLYSLCSGAERLSLSQRNLLLQRQRALLDRFASKAAPGLVRGFGCSFGWVHLRDGKALSGVN